MKDRSFTPRDSARGIELDEEIQIPELNYRRKKVSNTLGSRANSYQTKFLDKFKSRTVPGAIRKEGGAADEFIEHVIRFRKFGSLERDELVEAIHLAIEYSGSAAFAFITSAQRFTVVLGRDGMKQALYKAILEYSDCQNYFFRYFDERFGSVEGADEVYFQLTHLDQYEKGMIH